MSSSTDKFNTNLEQFLLIIINNYPDLKQTIESHYKFPLTGIVYINEYIKNCRNKGQDISTKNEIIFSEGLVLIEKVNFHKIWNDTQLSEEHKNNIWKYLHTLYLYSYEYTKNKNITSIIKDLKNIKSDDKSLDETTRTFLNIIESLTNNISNKDLQNTNIDNDNDDNDNGNNKETNSFANFKMPDIFGGTIGELAKEIAEEIDPEKINLDNPAELLKNLMSGNLENDTSGLMNLVSNITSKMHDKISSGDIDENKLFNDAKKVMSNFNNSNLGGNNMFSNLFSQMSNNFNTPATSTTTSTPTSTTSTPDDVNKIMSNLNNPNLGENSMFSNLFSQMSNNFNNPTSMPAPQANNRIKLQNRRERLRKKLEAKKKALKEKLEK